MSHTGVMYWWADRVGFYVLGGLVCFIIGGAIGCLTMKWTVDAELRTLRASNRELSRDARTCCDVAYVLNKYRAPPPQEAPKPSPQGKVR